MKEVVDKVRRHKGQAIVLVPLTMAVLIIIATALLVVLGNISTATAISTLEEKGYVVLASAEYQSISDKLDAIKTDAETAVATAEAAVTAAEIAAAKVDLFNSAEIYLFPATSNLTCTLTAGNTNVWSSWVELVDSGATTLSSSFSVAPGYVSDMLFFLPSDASDGYNVEVAYGEAKVTLGRVGFYALASGDIAYVLPIKSRRVPAGETIYYRMQSTGANNATVSARFRYFYE